MSTRKIQSKQFSFTKVKHGRERSEGKERERAGSVSAALGSSSVPRCGGPGSPVLEAGLEPLLRMAWLEKDQEA